MKPTGVLALGALVLAGIVVTANRESLSLQFGRLPSVKSEFLDGTGRWIEHGGWHLGNGTRTQGETHGIRLGTFYVVLGVRHTNPNITPEEAQE